MSAEEATYSPDWLGSREAADAAARAADLLDPLRARLDGTRPLVISDLGCGTGSMGRWLAPRLPGPQHWILYDRDPVLLAHAAAGMAGTAADGSPVTVETRVADVTRLAAADLAGTSLVTASALLDLFTSEEVAGLAAACVGAGSPALLTLSVVGRVELSPADPLDADVQAAFNAHQRRETGGRRLLGPDAPEVAADAFDRLRAGVRMSPSPWRLGPEHAGLAAWWLRGWVDAAGEQEPALADRVETYAAQRLAEAAKGDLRVVVHHCDLFVESE
jgi:SAM-dependent methyltransferase